MTTRAIKTRNGAENTIGEAFQPASASDFPVRGTVSDEWTEYRTGKSGEPACPPKQSVCEVGTDKNVCPTGTPLRVAVVDDDPALHAQVREQLQQAGEPWHVTAYHNGADALKGLTAAPPHVVMMDIGMPEMSGIECVHQLKQKHPALPVVMHTRRAQPDLVMSALRAGARGYVVKTSPLNGLVPLLNKAMTGGLALCVEAERLLMEAMHRTLPTAPEWGLTKREEEVLLCLCRHLSNKEVATALGLSEKTVNVHLAGIFKKLGVHDRKSAVQKFTAKWSEGGGGKMAGRDFGGLEHFRAFDCSTHQRRLSSM